VSARALRSPRAARGPGRRLAAWLLEAARPGLLVGLWVLAAELAYSRMLLGRPIRVDAGLLLLHASCFAILGALASLVARALPRAPAAFRAALLGVGLAVLMLGLRLGDLDDEIPLAGLVASLAAGAALVAGATAWIASRSPGEAARRLAPDLVLAGAAAVLAVAAKLLTDAPSVELTHPRVLAFGLVAAAPLLLAATLVPLLARLRHPGRAQLAAWCAPLAAIAAFAAAGSERVPAARGGPLPAPEARELPPIVWITVDTLRADRLHLYGHEVENTPNLDALARSATVYTRATSPAASTAAAVPSLLSGLTPYRHGAVSESRRLPGELRLLPELLRERGYRTVAQSANHWVSPRYGLGQGFDDFVHYSTDDALFLYDLMKLGTRVAPWLVFSLREQLPPYAYAPIGTLTDDAVAILRDHDPAHPLFLYIQPVDPHGPYQPPRRHLPAGAPPQSRRTFVSYWQLLAGRPVDAEQREAVLARYDGEVAYVDAELGRLFATLRERDLFDRSLLVFTSDHGEHFQEHGLWGHGKSLYAPLLRVPLVVKYPFQREGRVVDAAVSTLDLVPTILRLLGQRCEACDGMPLQQAGAPGRALFAYEMDDREVRPVRRGAIEGRWKLVRTSRDGAEREELFDIETDPGELHDLRLRYPEVAARLGALLRDYEAAAGPPPEPEPVALDPAASERLRELGYLR